MRGTGKTVRLSRIMPDGRTVLVPFDDALINGPSQGLRDTLQRVREVESAGADGIMGFRGLLSAYAGLGVRLPFVANLTASTVLGEHTRKAVVGTVESAVRAGCDGVAVHVNVSARHEAEMVATLANAGEACDRWDMPMLAIMYPRRDRDGADDNYLELKTRDRQAYAELVAHSVRIAVELGADMVKTQYTGDAESFASVVAVGLGVPIVIAGGPRVPIDEALGNAHGAVKAGAAGVCFGRNCYNRSDVARFVRMLVGVVHQGRLPEEIFDADRRAEPARCMEPAHP
jgi:DhnA family fructose-bisphosphate aldolase class Ia